MNYTKYIFLNTFIRNLIRNLNKFLFPFHIINRQKILLFASNYLAEIEKQINSIYFLQQDGYWPINLSDSNLIRYLSKIQIYLNEFVSSAYIQRSSIKELKNKLNDLLKEIKIYRNQKIKVTFLLQETVGWPSFESIYKAFHSDPNCITHLVYIPFEHVNNDAQRNWMEEYNSIGLDIINFDEYDLSKESPDFVFFSKPYDCIPMQFYIDNVFKIINRSIYIPYFINWMSEKAPAYLFNYHFQLPLHYKAWKIFDSPNFVYELHKKFGYKNGENVYCGHPRLDNQKRYKYLKNQIPKEWKKKIKHKKVFLWNTHTFMGTNNNSQNDWSTFGLFGLKIINYFSQHPDIVLLWRPHPSFFQGLINHGYFSQEEVMALKKDVLESENMILDLSSDYRLSIAASDALISDASSLLVEYLISLKPVLYTTKKETRSFVNQNILPCLFTSETWEEIENFIKLIRTNKNIMNKDKVISIKKLGILPHKNIGKKIKLYCIETMKKEEINAAKIQYQI